MQREFLRVTPFPCPKGRVCIGRRFKLEDTRMCHRCTRLRLRPSPAPIPS